MYISYVQQEEQIGMGVTEFKSRITKLFFYGKQLYLIATTVRVHCVV